MGYEWNFYGEFTIDPHLSASQIKELEQFADCSHEAIGPDGGTFCYWRPSEDGKTLHAPEEPAKFYMFEDWLSYLVKTFFEPWGCTLSGQVQYDGSGGDDQGTLYAEGFKVEGVDDSIANPGPSWARSPDWEAVAGTIYDRLYLDTGPDGDFYNPDKDWDSDTMDSIRDILAPHRLHIEADLKAGLS